MPIKPMKDIRSGCFAFKQIKTINLWWGERYQTCIPFPNLKKIALDYDIGHYKLSLSLFCGFGTILTY